MSTFAFDTYKFVDRLEKAGFTRDQSAALVAAQQESIDQAINGTVATKIDLLQTEARLDSKIESFRSDIKGEVLMLKWMMTVLVGLAAANFAKQYF